MGASANKNIPLDINLKYQNKEIVLQIDKNFNTFLEKVGEKLKISSQNLKSLSLTYTDEKSNNIIISNEEDYKKYYQKLNNNLIYNYLNIKDNFSLVSKDIILEVEVHPGGSTNVDQFMGLLIKAKEAICIIKTKIDGKDAHGTGFCTKIEDPDEEKQYINVLFTCNHVLKKEYLENNSMINIEINNTKKELKLENRRIWSDSELDYTCIEILKNDDIKGFLNIEEILLQPDYAIENYKNKGIYIFCFMKDLELGFDSGYILETKNNYLFHNCNTSGGCSGGAIINKATNNIIAIHKAGIKKNNYNIGVYMNSIINNMKSQKQDTTYYYFSIVIMGDSNSGKYEFLEKIEDEKDLKENQVIVATNKIVKSRKFNALIQFWDYDFFNSENKYILDIFSFNQKIFQYYLQERLFDKIILFYDSRNKNTFKNIELYYEKIKNFWIKTLLLGNTFSMENKNIKEISDTLAKDYAEKNNIEFLEFNENTDINKFLTELLEIMAVSKILNEMQNHNSISEKYNRIKNELGDSSIHPHFKITSNKDLLKDKENNNNNE